MLGGVLGNGHGWTRMDPYERSDRVDCTAGRRPLRDHPGPTRTACARLGVKGSQVQILSARPYDLRVP
jgi:hypothetical protein